MVQYLRLASYFLCYFKLVWIRKRYSPVGPYCRYFHNHRVYIGVLSFLLVQITHPVSIFSSSSSSSSSSSLSLLAWSILAVIFHSVAFPHDGNFKHKPFVVPRGLHGDGGENFALGGGRYVFFCEDDIPGNHHSFILTLIKPSFVT